MQTLRYYMSGKVARLHKVNCADGVEMSRSYIEISSSMYYYYYSI